MKKFLKLKTLKAKLK